MAIMNLSQLDSDVYNKYNDSYRQLTNDHTDILNSLDVRLFSYLTDLVLNRRELDKSSISNYDFAVIAKLMVNGHIALTPEIAVSRELWCFMTDVLFDVDIKEVMR